MMFFDSTVDVFSSRTEVLFCGLHNGVYTYIPTPKANKVYFFSCPTTQ